MERRIRKKKLSTKESQVSSADKSVDTYNGRAPFVFSIPRMYDDDYERNDSWYIQLQKMEKRAKNLKTEMRKIAERHSYLYLKTKKMVEATLERCNKLAHTQPLEEGDSLLPGRK